MNNLHNRHLIAIVISMTIHGLVFSLFLLTNSLPVMTQSRSEGKTTVISIQMALVNAPTEAIIETDSSETGVPPIVNDNALIKENPTPPSPRKEDIKPKSTSRKPVRKTENKKQVKRAEQNRGEPTRTADNVNAREGSRSSSALAGISRGESLSKSSYLSLLLASIESHKKYPPEARQKEGRSIVAFRLTEKGDIYDVSLRKSSGYSVLDAAAVSAVQRGGLALSPPADLPRSMTVTVTFSVH